VVGISGRRLIILANRDGVNGFFRWPGLVTVPPRDCPNRWYSAVAKRTAPVHRRGFVGFLAVGSIITVGAVATVDGFAVAVVTVAGARLAVFTSFLAAVHSWVDRAAIDLADRVADMS